MAFYETRTIQVANDPNVIDKTNELMGEFFWEVKSQQITDRKDSHTEHTDYGSYIEERVVTSSANYCTITYQRDKMLPHYDEVVNIERTLDVIHGIQNRKIPRSKSIYDYRWLLLILFWPLGLCLILTNKMHEKTEQEKVGEQERMKEAELSKYPSEKELMQQIEALRRQIFSEMRG